MKIGVILTASRSERKTAIARVKAIGLKKMPVNPVTKISGTKTITVVIVAPNIGGITSAEPLTIALCSGCPSE
ncbi:hypothetical protein BMS3Abin03_00601 [bacterium BMS3Abin03]|nr:hypothetical protein BMS3Abin03_00601 [bacterium BMS3Abin03]